MDPLGLSPEKYLIQSSLNISDPLASNEARNSCLKAYDDILRLAMSISSGSSRGLSYEVKCHALYVGSSLSSAYL